MAVDTQKLRERWSALRSSSMLFRSTCDDIEKYVMPRVGSTRVQHQAGSEGTVMWRDPDVWDATAPVALTKLAAHVQSAVIPHGLRWASFEFLDATLREDKTACEWLEKNCELLFHALEESDFYAEMSTAFPEYIGLGNMVVVQEVVEKGGTFDAFDYTAIPIGEIEFEEDSKGQLKTLYRCLRWTAVQIVDKFGAEKVPQHIREQAASPAGSSTRIDVVFTVFEREDVLAKPILDRVAAPDKRPYGSVYFLGASGEILGEEGGYYGRPGQLARFERTPSSRWGHGLGHQALPTVKGLNADLELWRTKCALEVDPPEKVTERGLLSKIDRRPGGVTVVESLEDTAPLNPTHGRAEVGQMSVTDERNEVRRLFREDQLELRDSPQMTATEAQIRYDIMLKLLGPTLARLLSEFLSPMLLEAYRALYRAGRFPPAPPSVAQAGAEIRIQYQSPMARARRTDEVASLERLAAFAAGLLKMGFDEAGMVFNAEAALREVAKLLDVPVTVLRSKSEVKQLMAARAAMEQRAAAAKASKDEASAAATAAGAGPLPAAATGAFPAAPMPALTPGGQVA